MRSMQQQLGVLGTISAFAYRQRETKKNLIQLSKQKSYSTIRNVNNRCYPPEIIFFLFPVTTLYTTRLAPLSSSTASVSLPISLYAANRLSCSKISVSSGFPESKFAMKFKTDGPELPAGDASSRSLCCTNNASPTPCILRPQTKLHKTEIFLRMDVQLCVFSTKNRLLGRTAGPKLEEVYLFYFKSLVCIVVSCLVCIVVSCLVCIVVSCLVCIVVSCLVCIVVILYMYVQNILNMLHTLPFFFLFKMPFIS